MGNLARPKSRPYTSTREGDALFAPPEDSMDRYDWSRARRGYWAGKLRRGDMRTLEPDLAKAFPDDASVNSALRAVLEAAKAIRRAG